MEKLQIFVGLSGDTPVCHTYTTTPGTYAGRITAGPTKLLELLELHLGLSGIFPAETERVISLKEKLAQLQDVDLPFLKSFKGDPLGVSRRLLKLWETWRLSGWKVADADDLPARMKQLVSLRSIFENIGDGLVERIVRVMERLKESTLPPISIHLVDPIDSFPYLYRQLLEQLKLYAEIKIEEFSPKAPPDSDLGKLQRVLQGERAESVLKNDKSLQILFFPNDILAANAVYSIQNAAKWNPVIVNTDNSLLNGLNLSRNTPVCRWQTASGNGQVSQLFFLATALFKRPVECSQVLAFLASPILPFSKKLARPLLHAFSEKPGFDNEKWNKVISEYFESIKGQPRERTKRKAINFWLQNNRVFNQDELDIQLLNDIYNTLHTWATQSAQIKFYELYKEQLLNLASLCEQLITSLIDEGDVISVAKFERLQSELFSDVPATIAEAQVGCADAVTLPGAVWCDTTELLWMNAVRYEPTDVLTRYWYQEEKEFFRKNNLPVHDESHQNTIYNEGLKRMVLNITDRLVIVIPTVINGAVASKPFCLDEWEKLVSPKEVSIDASEPLQSVPWDKEQSITKAFSPINLPGVPDYISIAPTGFERKEESFSSLEKLFQHPAQWYIEYTLNLKYKPGVKLPEERQLRGTVADAVVQELFKEENTKASWWQSDETFKEWVMTTTDKVLLCEGLPFLETAGKRTLQEYKKTLANSLCALRNFITINGFSIAATQCEVKGNIDKTPFSGDVDLLLMKDEKYCVVDLKWAGSSNKYYEKIKQGTDLQLALYQQMQTSATASGFFMLNDGRMYMRDEGRNNLFQQVTLVRPDDGVSAKLIYEKAINSLQYRRAEMQEGKLEVAYELPLEEVGYQTDSPQKNLFPLEQDKKMKKEPYGNDLNLFFGNIN